MHPSSPSPPRGPAPHRAAQPPMPQFLEPHASTPPPSSRFCPLPAPGHRMELDLAHQSLPSPTSRDSASAIGVTASLSPHQCSAPSPHPHHVPLKSSPSSAAWATVPLRRRGGGALAQPPRATRAHGKRTHHHSPPPIFTTPPLEAPCYPAPRNARAG